MIRPITTQKNKEFHKLFDYSRPQCIADDRVAGTMHCSQHRYLSTVLPNVYIQSTKFQELTGISNSKNEMPACATQESVSKIINSQKLAQVLYMYFLFLAELRKFTISDFPKQTHFGHILIILFFFFNLYLIDPHIDIVFQPMS